jgi:hypothetical protein
MFPSFRSLSRLAYAFASCCFAGFCHCQAQYQADDVSVWTPKQREIRGVIILCPGQNGDGRPRVEEEEWVLFAEAEGFALAAIAFQSPDEELREGKGYFDASAGSGAALESALQLAGAGDLPLYFLGFSGGAHFSMSFASWKPKRVAAFCVQGFARWISPPTTLTCAAIISCGTHDGLRYGSTFAYFQAGRKNLAPWIWISLGDTSHEGSTELESFFREFVRHVARKRINEPVVVDNVTEHEVRNEPCVLNTSVLPSKELHSLWQRLHQP